jgi:hypothetical protein
MTWNDSEGRNDSGEKKMAFRRSDLQEAFFVHRKHAFRVFGYGTGCGLEEVLAAGYFGAAGGSYAPAIWSLGCPAGSKPAVRMALPMVCAGARGAVNVDDAGPAGRDRAAAKGGRGHPPAAAIRKWGNFTVSTLASIKCESLL